MTPKVFKIPDGKGGIIYQIQTPDGQWHDTDEAGNILEKPDPVREDGAPLSQKCPKGERKKAKRNASPKDRSAVNFNLQRRTIQSSQTMSTGGASSRRNGPKQASLLAWPWIS